MEFTPKTDDLLPFLAQSGAVVVLSAPLGRAVDGAALAETAFSACGSVVDISFPFVGAAKEEAVFPLCCTRL